MKKLLNALLSIISFGILLPSIHAQNHDGLYGNEWIIQGQDYYKVKIAEDGFYRLSSQTLQNAGVPISTINPDHLQMIVLGKEIPIHVETNNGVIDYIEFYGQKHKGELDVNLYSDDNDHFNQQYSLINDTMAYFLSWNATLHERYTTSSANLTNLPPKEDYCIASNQVVYTSTWNSGAYYNIAGESLTKSTFEDGEGFGSQRINILNIPIATPNIYPSAGTPVVYARVFAVDPNHNQTGNVHELEILVNNNSVLTKTILDGDVTTHNASINNGVLAASNTVTIRGNNGSSDLYNISHVSIEYPHTFDFEGASSFSFKLPASTSRQYLEITNIDATGASAQNIYLFDKTNNLRIQCFWNGSMLLTDLPASNQERELILVNFGASNTFQNITNIQPVTFTNLSNFSFSDYIIVSHSSLRQDAQGNDPVLEYAAFRSSTGFQPAIFDIDELYNHFAYGVGYHPVAVRNFAAYIKDNWSDPQYLFLIGKGLEYKDSRTTIPSNYKIPTFGYPPSDNLLTSRIGSAAPVLATGRLAATTPDQVRIYLEKMIAMKNEVDNVQQTPNDVAWTKNVLHLGGGRNSFEQSLIRGNLDAMKSIAEDPYYGARVESFFKTSSSPIQVAQSAFLDSLINNGVSLITFFGHSSANSFDFNLDYPSNYDNYAKYPLIMALGCYGGTIFESSVGISEQFVFENEAGASVFLASSGAATLTALDIFGRRFYTSMSDLNYGEGSGVFVQQAISYLESVGQINDHTIEMACHYMIHHGDPAYDLHAHDRPDYYIDNDLVSHAPSLVTTQMNEFQLMVDVQNLGRAIDTSFFIEVTRQYADGTSALIAKQQVTAPYFSDLYPITIQVEGDNPSFFRN